MLQVEVVAGRCLITQVVQRVAIAVRVGNVRHFFNRVVGAYGGGRGVHGL